MSVAAFAVWVASPGCGDGGALPSPEATSPRDPTGGTDGHAVDSTATDPDTDAPAASTEPTDDDAGRTTSSGGSGSSDDTGDSPLDLIPGDLFTADYSTLDGNWFFRDTENEGIAFLIAHRDAGGPGGRDAIELVQLPSAADGPFGQFGWGHRHQIPGFEGDVSRFFRWRMRMDPRNDYRALNWDPPGDPTHSSNKLVAMGESEGRYITNVEAAVDGQWRLESNVDGGGNQASTPPLESGVWYSIQIEYRYGAEAYVKIWIDEDEYASPSAETETIELAAPSNAGNFSFGAFNNVGLAETGVFTWRHADFRVSTTFDSSWHASL